MFGLDLKVFWRSLATIAELLEVIASDYGSEQRLTDVSNHNPYVSVFQGTFQGK